MANDERISATEWNSKKVCPICEDIKHKRLDLDGEQIMIDDKHPAFCPDCGHTDIRMHHTVTAVGVGKDFGPWRRPTLDPSSDCPMRVMSLVSRGHDQPMPWQPVG